VVLIYAFTQWLASLALVLANAELRFLWLGLATSVLIAVVVACHRSLERDRASALEAGGDPGAPVEAASGSVLAASDSGAPRGDVPLG
jgi:hypothetical protein